MSRKAGISGRGTICVAAMLLPFLALTGCANGDQAMADKLAAAEAAATRAEAAQKAAESAAASVNSHPAPAAPEASVVSDAPNGPDGDDADESGDGSDHDSGTLSLGEAGQTVTADGVVIPGQGV